MLLASIVAGNLRVQVDCLGDKKHFKDILDVQDDQTGNGYRLISMYPNLSVTYRRAFTIKISMDSHGTFALSLLLRLTT